MILKTMRGMRAPVVMEKHRKPSFSILTRQKKQLFNFGVAVGVLLSPSAFMCLTSKCSWPAATTNFEQWHKRPKIKVFKQLNERLLSSCSTRVPATVFQCCVLCGEGSHPRCAICGRLKRRKFVGTAKWKEPRRDKRYERFKKCQLDWRTFF